MIQTTILFFKSIAQAAGAPWTWIINYTNILPELKLESNCTPSVVGIVLNVFGWKVANFQLIRANVKFKSGQFRQHSA